MILVLVILLGADKGTTKQDIPTTAAADDSAPVDTSTSTTELAATEHISEVSTRAYIEQHTSESGNSSKVCGEGQCPDILHGEPLTDRKSTFQAHVAAVRTKQEVRELVMCACVCTLDV